MANFLTGQWLTSQGSITTDNTIAPLPPSGEYIKGATKHVTMYQEHEFSSQELDDIAAGAVIHFHGFCRSSYNEDTIKVRCVFYAAQGEEDPPASLQTTFTTTAAKSGSNWVHGEFSEVNEYFAVPAGAVKVRFEVELVYNATQKHVSGLEAEVIQVPSTLITSLTEFDQPFISAPNGVGGGDFVLPNHAESPNSANDLPQVGGIAVGRVGAVDRLRFTCDLTQYSDYDRRDTAFFRGRFFTLAGEFLGESTSANIKFLEGEQTLGITRSLYVPAGAEYVVLTFEGTRKYGTVWHIHMADLAVSAFDFPSWDGVSCGLSHSVFASSFSPDFSHPWVKGTSAQCGAKGTRNLSYATFTQKVSCSYRGFVPLMYDRLYLIPTKVDFGVITKDEQVNYVLWNAYVYHRVTMDGYSFDLSYGQSQSANGGGVDFAPIGLPHTFGQIGYREFTAFARKEGPPQLLAKLDHHFANLPSSWVPGATTSAGEVSFYMSGLRAQFSPFNHNWNTDFNKTFTFKTEIMESWSGHEQRRATRHHPRGEIELSGILPAQTKSDVLWQTGHSMFMVPDCTQTIHLTPNGGGYDCDRDASWLQEQVTVVTGKACCGVQPNILKIVTVDRSGAKPHITLSAAPEDHVIRAVIIGRMTTANQDYPIASSSQASVTYTTLPELFPPQPRTLGAVPADGIAYDTGVTYAARSESGMSHDITVRVLDGMEIFELPHNWVQRVSVNIDPRWHNNDVDKGVVKYNSPKHLAITLKMGYLLEGGVEYVQDFFFRVKGRRSAFLLKDPLKTRRLTTGVDTTSAVVSVDTPLQPDDGPVPYAVELVSPAARTTVAIDHINEEGDIFLKHEAGQAFTVEDTKVIMVYKARLATDKLELQYSSTGAVKVSLGAVLLRG